MKKLAAVFFICFVLNLKGYCQTNNDEIKMDSIPVLEVNQHTEPKTIKTNKEYYAPLIDPAQERKPTLNFNLNNIKNIKKGAILPYENLNQSVTNIYQYFTAPYDKVFSHLVSIIDNSELEIVSYDSSSGRIFANYKNTKPVYITVSQHNSSTVLVKIIPADGIYDLPANLSSKIFSELNNSLVSK